MKDLNISISEKGTRLLKEIIGQNLISITHDKFNSDNSVDYAVAIATSKARYAIINDVEWFDDFCAGPNDLPFLDFKELGAEENPLGSRTDDELSTYIINEKIEDVLLVQDRAKVFEGKEYCQQMDSTEGIVIVTDRCQYGFFKENMWLDSEMMVWAGDDVVSKIKSLKEHFDIFGQPFNAKCKRCIVSLMDGIEKEIETAEEIGEMVAEESE